MTVVKGKDVIGLNVVTIVDGTIIETVKDIAYNPETQRVEALFVTTGGLFSSAKAIHMDDVRNIGEDAVIVQDVSVMKSVKEHDDNVRAISDSDKYLVKTNILTVDGKDLGNVTDIFFDSSSGMVDSMEVSQGGLKHISEGKKSIRPSDIVTIGANATIVSNYTESKFEAQGEEGGLKGAINDVKAKTSDIVDDTQQALSEAADTTKKRTAAFAESAREKSLELRDDA